MIARSSLGHTMSATATPWIPTPAVPPARVGRGFAIDELEAAAHRRAIAVGLAVVAVLCYVNALANQFTLDDLWVIDMNPMVHSISGLWRGFAHSYWPEMTHAGQYRPLAIMSFTLDWAIAGRHPWWFHLVNILWHVAATLLVWRLLETMVPTTAAAAGALLFAVQPVHVEAVANTVGRSEIMMTVFVLAGLLAHRRGSRLAILWFALAVLSKESGVVLLGLVAAHDVLFHARPLERLRAQRALYAGYAVVVVCYALTLLYIFRGGHFVMVAPPWTEATTRERLLTVLRIVPEYVRLMTAPYDLRIDYTPRTIMLEHGWSPLVVLGAVLLAIIGAATLVAARRAPPVAYGFLVFAIAISPVANVVFASGVVIAERSLYLPSVGAAILAACAVQWLTARRPAVAVAAVVVVAAAFAARAWTRTPIWHDNKTLIVRELAEQPESYRAHATAAAIFNLALNWPASRREAAVSRSLYSGDPVPYLAGVEAELAMGAPRDSILSLLDSAIAVGPTTFASRMRMAEVRYMWGDYRESMAAAWQAYLLSPDSIRAVNYVTLSAQKLGDYAAADSAFRRVLADHPDAWIVRRGYASMLRERGDTAAASRQNSIVLATRPR